MASKSAMLTSLVSLRVRVGLLLSLPQLGRNQRVLHVKERRNAFGFVHDELSVGSSIAVAVAVLCVSKLLGRSVVPVNVGGRW